jgi:hypothetical protein
LKKIEFGGRRPPEIFSHRYNFPEFLAPQNGGPTRGEGHEDLCLLPTAPTDSAIV